jgi:uncharacterized protein
MDALATKTLLYDFYGDMLTERQQEIFEDYYLNDCSLGEIAQQLEISRAAVQDHLKRCDKTLTHLEDTLHLVDRYLKNKQVLSRLLEITYDKNTQEALEKIRQSITEFIESM